MYIKTYENQINSSPDLNPQNLAITTPEGLNLNRFLLRRSVSKTQRTCPLSPVKADPLMQILQTSPEAEIKIYPHFYQSNCFGITLKNNRIREIKARSRGIYELLRNGAREEQQQIQENSKEEQTLRFNNRDIRSLSKRRLRNKNKLAQFKVSGRPASRDPKYGQSFRQKIQNKQNYVHQTVLDFTKLTRQQQNLAHESSSARPAKYTQLVFDPQKVEQKQVKTDNHHQLYRHKSNNHCDSHNINTRPKKWKYNSHYTKHQDQHQRQHLHQHQHHQYLQFQNHFGDDQYMATEPQILVDYRRSMSSGRKRVKVVSGEQDGQGELAGGDLVGVQGEKINAWAVKKLEQDQQLVF